MEATRHGVNVAETTTPVSTASDMHADLEDRVRRIALSVNRGDMKDAVAILNSRPMKRCLGGEATTLSTPSTFASSAEPDSSVAPPACITDVVDSLKNDDEGSPIKRPRPTQQKSSFDSSASTPLHEAPKIQSSLLPLRSEQFDEGTSGSGAGLLFCCSVRRETHAVEEPSDNGSWFQSIIGFLSPAASAGCPAAPEKCGEGTWTSSMEPAPC